MKNLIALILCILVIFTSCQKADVKKDDTTEVSTIEQEILVEIVVEKTELEPVVEIEPEPKSQIGVITDTRVRLRSEANLQSETLEYLNTGDKLIILDRSAEQQKIDTMLDYWYKVQVEGYPEGWVYGAFVDIEKDYEIVWVDFEFEKEVREILHKYRDPIMKSDLDGLTSLKIMGKNIVRIDDIAHFKNLTSLDFGAGGFFRGEINDISGLAGLINLTELDLPLNNISDISALSGLTNLTKLDLGWNDINDISPLAGLTNLTELFLWDNSISDLSALSGLTSLTNVILSDNDINNISALSSLTNLKRLDLGGNLISDLSPLSNLTSLANLNLATNQISDISVLPNLTIALPKINNSNQKQ